MYCFSIKKLYYKTGALIESSRMKKIVESFSFILLNKSTNRNLPIKVIFSCTMSHFSKLAIIYLFFAVLICSIITLNAFPIHEDDKYGLIPPSDIDTDDFTNMDLEV